MEEGMEAVCRKYCRGCERTVLAAEPPFVLEQLRPCFTPLIHWAQSSSSNGLRRVCLKALWAVCVAAELPNQDSNSAEVPHGKQSVPHTEDALQPIIRFVVEQLKQEVEEHEEPVGDRGDAREDVQALLCNCAAALASRSNTARIRLTDDGISAHLAKWIELQQPPALATRAAMCISVLLLDPRARKQFLGSDGVTSCLAHLRNSCDNVLAECLLAILRVLVTQEDHTTACKHLQDLNAVPTLINFISRQGSSVANRTQALATLSAMAEGAHLRQEIADARFFSIVFKLLTNTMDGWDGTPVREDTGTFSLPAITGRSTPRRRPQQRTRSPAHRSADTLRSTGGDDGGKQQQQQQQQQQEQQDLVSAALLCVATVLLDMEHNHIRFFDEQGLAVVLQLAQSTRGKMHLPEICSVLLSLCEGSQHHQFIDQGGLEILFQTALADLDAVSVSQACSCLRHLLQGTEPIAGLAAEQHFNLEGTLKHLAARGGSAHSPAVKAEAKAALGALGTQRSPKPDVGTGKTAIARGRGKQRGSKQSGSKRAEMPHVSSDEDRSSRLERISALMQSL